MELGSPYWLGLVPVLLILWRLRKGMFKNRRNTRKRAVALESLSQLWKVPTEAEANQGSVVVAAPAGDSEAPEPVFQHDEITRFYQQHVQALKGTIAALLKEVLSILDREGDCPSVVNTTGEAEATLDRSVYDVLGQTPLYKHTLHVAEEVLRLIQDGPLRPKALLAALAHDLGKTPAYRGKLYALGDHPLISVTVLGQLPGFRELPYGEEVSKAIRDHHRNPTGFLPEKLKQADQAARRREMAENLPAQTAPPQSNERLPQKVQPAPVIHTAAEIFGGPRPKPKGKMEVRLQTLALPWLEAEVFLDLLNPFINRLNGGRWDAFSMREGTVYVQVKTMWEITKKIARQHKKSEVLLADTDEALRRNYLLSVVEKLKDDKDAIARGLIQDGYFGAPFIVRLKTGDEMTKGFYTPFNAEAFGENVSDLEARKVGKIREIVAVLPKFE